jgi:hypothetical protein
LSALTVMRLAPDEQRTILFFSVSRSTAPDDRTSASTTKPLRSLK